MKRKNMLTQKALANKRHNKKLKRKNKKYTGPKYSRLKTHMLWAPLLIKAGIMEAEAPDYEQITGNNSTSFTE